MRLERQECDTNEKSAKQVKIFDFDNDMNENTFSHPILAIWQMRDYKERKNFQSKTYLLEMPRSMQKCG